MEEPKDTSLRETFDLVKQKQQQLDIMDPQSAIFKDNLQFAIQNLEHCQKMIKDLSIFSPNEELEDISTQNLRYLTVDYLLAELLLKSYEKTRLASLQRSSRLLESFLERLDQYSTLSKADRKLYERFQDNRSGFSLLSTANAEERRRVKISRFQEEKQLKKKLEVSA
jgi:immunoglobulin-binding protein 1